MIAYGIWFGVMTPDDDDDDALTRSQIIKII